MEGTELLAQSKNLIATTCPRAREHFVTPLTQDTKALALGLDRREPTLYKSDDMFILNARDFILLVKA